MTVIHVISQNGQGGGSKTASVDPVDIKRRNPQKPKGHPLAFYWF